MSSPYRGVLKFLTGAALKCGSCAVSATFLFAFVMFTGFTSCVVGCVQPCQRDHTSVPVSGDSSLLPSIAWYICYTGKSKMLMLLLMMMSIKKNKTKTKNKNEEKIRNKRHYVYA